MKECYNDTAFWQWVENHKADDVNRLRLAASSLKDTAFDVTEAINQIECRRRFGKKLNETLARFPRFYFPTVLSGEQCTSDILADFKRNFINPDDEVVDLTAGLGIDAFGFAAKARHVTAIERNKTLCDALRYNSAGLGIENIEVENGDCTELAASLKGTVAYIDPARRAGDGSRVFGFADCNPDILTMMPLLKERFGRVIIKASPMLDVTQACREITEAAAMRVTDVYILGTPTECKEIDILTDSSDKNESAESTTKIHAVTVFSDSGAAAFEFTRQEDNAVSEQHKNASPAKGDILYVPYPATMKAAPNKLLSGRFNIAKFHSNTHLYYGEPSQPQNDFPGEKLRIVDVVPWQSKYLKRFKTTYPVIPAITVRNFGITAEALRTKLGVKQSGKAVVDGIESSRLRLFGIGLGNNHTDRLLIVATDL